MSAAGWANDHAQTERYLARAAALLLACGCLGVAACVALAAWWWA